MIVLGLDTATPSSAAALRLADGRTSEARDDPRPGEHPGHATRLLGLARELLDEEGVGWREIERIAVGAGPGTFTGLRVGIATARGLAQSLAVELVSVSSLRALAHGALVAAEAGTDTSAGEWILAAIDARRGEVFAAAYRAREPGSLREMLAPVAVAPALLPELLARAQEEIGVRVPGWLAVGDGAIRYRAELDAGDVHVPSEDSPLHRVSAAAVCTLGADAPAGGGYQSVLPDYRRRPDAELALRGAGAGEDPPR